jgi:acyl-CoA thioesterase
MPTDFSQVLASIAPAGDAGYEVTVPPDWLQGRAVFGGMQMAIATRAMRAAMSGEQRALPLRSAQMTFVGPVNGGEPISLHAQVLRTGRSATHARCDLAHGDGGVACTVVGIFGVSRMSQFVRELPRPDPGRSPDDGLVSLDEGLLVPAFLQHFEARVAVGALPYSGYAEPRSLVYVRLRDRDCGPEDALLALADVLPTPAVAMLRKAAPVSSLNWMIEILRDPARLDLHDWVLIDTEVRAGTDGYLSQTSLLYGADGHAYSASHQTVGVFG